MAGAPRQIGPYRIVRELARGGMGVVYVAQHVQLGRQVALKQILDTSATGSEGQRFQIEAQALGRLHHPNIVAIHDVGVSPQGPYFAMELVEGRSLKAVLADGPVDPRQAAEWTVALARALEHAHGLGILHRDLKPANVLLTAGGRPQLTDFGLAHDVNAERERLTRTGQMLGTPAYMATEQADGDLQAIGPCTDVYGLGATLYHLLCGQPPFSGATAMNIVAKLLSDDPTPVRTHRPECDADLETIVLKCLAKEPAERYASAAALAEDLERYLADEPILGQAPKRAERWLRRHPRALAGVGIAGLLVLGVAAAVLGPWQRPIADAKASLDACSRSLRRSSSRPEAIAPLLDQLDAAESLLRTSRERGSDLDGLDTQLAAVAGQAIRVAEQGDDLATLDRTLALGQRVFDATSNRGQAQSLGEALASGPAKRQRIGNRRLKALEKLSGAARVAAATNWLDAFPGHPNTREVAKLRLTSPLVALETKGQRGWFLQGGRLLLTAHLNDPGATSARPVKLGFRLWHVEGGTQRATPWGWTRELAAHEPAPWGADLATNRSGGSMALRVENRVHWADLPGLREPKQPIDLDSAPMRTCLALDEEGERVLVGLNVSRSKGRLTVYGRDGRQLGSLDREAVIRNAVFVPRANTLVVTSRRDQAGTDLEEPVSTSRVFVWDLTTGEVRGSAHALPYPAMSLAIDPAGKRVAVGDSGDAVHVLELRDLALHAYPPSSALGQLPTNPFEAPEGRREVRSVAFSPDGALLYALVNSKLLKKDPTASVRIYDTTTGERLYALDLDNPKLSQMQLSADGDRLLLYGPGTAQVWNAWRQ